MSQGKSEDEMLLAEKKQILSKKLELDKQEKRIAERQAKLKAHEQAVESIMEKTREKLEANKKELHAQCVLVEAAEAMVEERRLETARERQAVTGLAKGNAALKAKLALAQASLKAWQDQAATKKRELDARRALHAATLHERKARVAEVEASLKLQWARAELAAEQQAKERADLDRSLQQHLSTLAQTQELTRRREAELAEQQRAYDLEHAAVHASCVGLTEQEDQLAADQERFGREMAAWEEEKESLIRDNERRKAEAKFLKAEQQRLATKQRELSEHSAHEASKHAAAAGRAAEAEARVHALQADVEAQERTAAHLQELLSRNIASSESKASRSKSAYEDLEAEMEKLKQEQSAFRLEAHQQAVVGKQLQDREKALLYREQAVAARLGEMHTKYAQLAEFQRTFCASPS